MSISSETARKSQAMAREALEYSLDMAQVKGKFQAALAALAPPINNISSHDQVWRWHLRQPSWR